MVPLDLSWRVSLALAAREDDEVSSAVLLPEREAAVLSVSDTPDGRFVAGVFWLDDVLGGGGIGGPPGSSCCRR